MEIGLERHDRLAESWLLVSARSMGDDRRLMSRRGWSNWKWMSRRRQKGGGGGTQLYSSVALTAQHSLQKSRSQPTEPKRTSQIRADAAAKKWSRERRRVLAGWLAG